MTATSLALDVSRACAPADRMSALRRETDWSGLWFDLIEKEFRRVTSACAPHTCRPQARRPSGTSSPTASRDGIGALVRADAPRQSGRRHSHAALERHRASRRGWRRSARCCASWRCGHAARDGRPTIAPGTPPAGVPRPAPPSPRGRSIAEQTRRLEARARAERVSFNSLLLATLGRATQSELGDGPATG